MCGEPHTSLSRYWCVTTLPACCARICRSLYSFGVIITRWPLSVTMRAARSMFSGPALTIGSPAAARTWRRIAACARASSSAMPNGLARSSSAAPRLSRGRAIRYHYSRHSRPGTQSLHHIAAFHVRQAYVKDDEVGLLQRHPFQRVGAGFGVLHHEAVEFQSGAQEAADLHLVIDD